MLSTVLIIDKRTELSTKYKKCISETDAKVVINRSMKEAMLSVQNLEPDMIIVSDSIGEDLAIFCQRIRALTYNSRPIIIALSKSADANDRICVLENGADDFISEPVNIEEFKTRRHKPKTRFLVKKILVPLAVTLGVAAGTVAVFIT